MKSIFSIKNKVIIVTGVSSGIGKYIANKLVLYGAIVYGISRKKIEKVKYKVVQCDLRDTENLKKEIHKIYIKHKKISVLINNAGITKITKNLDENLKSFEEVVNINTKIPIILANFCFKYMKKKDCCSIINICSLASKLGFPNNTSYIASKGALSQATKSLAMDFSKKNIRVNNILPGYIKTKMTIKSFKNKKKYNLRKNRTMLNRWGFPEDILGAIVFLSSESSNYITGSDIIVDGGWASKGL